MLIIKETKFRMASTNKSTLQNKFTHERDKQLEFEEGAHRYVILCDSDSKYTSVTTWNHEHFPKFEADKVIDNMMKSKNWKPGHSSWIITEGEGTCTAPPTKEEIIKRWHDNGVKQSTAGTKLHNDIEYFMNLPVPYEGPLRHHHLLAYYNENKQVIDNDSVEWHFFLQFVESYPNLRPYRTEWMIWDEDLKLAGSIDMIYENDDNETLSIYDWKRAKSIVKEKENPLFNTYAITECINHLVDTNFWHYSLQLNTYKAMLERKYDKKITDLVLVRLHPDNPENTFELIPVADLQEEIKNLFDLRLNPVQQVTKSFFKKPQPEPELAITKSLFKIPLKKKKSL